MPSSSTHRFTHHIPTRIVFGDGVLESIGEYMDFADRLIVVTGRGSAIRHGYLDRLVSALNGKVEAIYSNISPNPRLSEVEEAAELGREAGCQAVIGLGGGSALDAAKAVAVAIAAPGDIRKLFAEARVVPDETLPVVAIPTTAGTGSETSKAAILTDEQQVIKKGLRGDALLPALAIVDPELTYSVPIRVTAETGFDILTHAIETWVSRKSNALTAIYSREAIRRVVRWLPTVLGDPFHAEGRRELMLASTLMGINLAHSSTCLPHRLQYPLGARTDTSHAAGLAAIYVAWCQATWPFAEDIFGQISELLGSQCSKGYEAPTLIRQFLRKIGLSQTLSDLGGSGEMCRQMVTEVTGSLDNDPGDTSPEALLRIYTQSLSPNRTVSAIESCKL